MWHPHSLQGLYLAIGEVDTEERIRYFYCLLGAGFFGAGFFLGAFLLITFSSTFIFLL
jgi:hypothetical protein